MQRAYDATAYQAGRILVGQVIPSPTADWGKSSCSDRLGKDNFFGYLFSYYGTITCIPRYLHEVVNGPSAWCSVPSLVGALTRCPH